MRPVWYTDGSCKANGNPDAQGGWAAICVDLDDNGTYKDGNNIIQNLGKIIAFGTNKTIGTTNNRMEMAAIIYAVEHRIEGYPLIIRSDSAYAVNTFNNWMYNWQRNGWLKSDNTQPENLDLVQRYYNLVQDTIITLEKVPGHATNVWNNFADGLATGRISLYELQEYRSTTLQ